MSLQRNNHGEYQLMTANGDLLFVMRSMGQINYGAQRQEGWDVVRVHSDRVEWTEGGEPFISVGTRTFIGQYSTPIHFNHHRLLSDARRAVAQEAQRTEQIEIDNFLSDAPLFFDYPSDDDDEN